MSLRDVNKASVISSIIFCLVATVFIILNKDRPSYYIVLHLTHRNYKTFCDFAPLKTIYWTGSSCFKALLKGEEQNIEPAVEFFKGKENTKDSGIPRRKLYWDAKDHNILKLCLTWWTGETSLQGGKKPRLH